MWLLIHAGPVIMFVIYDSWDYLLLTNSNIVNDNRVFSQCLCSMGSSYLCFLDWDKICLKKCGYYCTCWCLVYLLSQAISNHDIETTTVTVKISDTRCTKFQKPKYILSRLAVAFAHSIEARCQVENEDIVGAVPTGDAPKISEWSAVLLPIKVCLLLEVWR